MKDKDLENVKLLMWDNLDLALQLIKGQGWDLKEVLLELWNKFKNNVKNISTCDMKYCNHDIMNIYVYNNYISVWYEEENNKVLTTEDAIDFIIEQLISDNRWDI